jgi:hypothetical protein
MGKYTVLNDSQIDQTIEDHMRRIVDEITTRMSPDSIILRGSFGRGEGSIMIREGKPHFLSDYEIDVTTKSPFHRSLFARLTKKLSDEFGMQAGIRWMRPDCFIKDRIGPFPIGEAKPTISLYEFRYGSQVLWGRDLFADSPPINPDDINLMSGLNLLLNRMAESFFYMSLDDDYMDSEGLTYYWINKAVLACAESILLVNRKYHFSYHERGKRFSELSEDRLNLPDGNVDQIKDLVKKATEFKLRPNLETYPHTVRETWLQVLPFCEVTLRWLVENLMEKRISQISEFPRVFIDYTKENTKYDQGKLSLLVNLHEIYRAFHSRHWPPVFSGENRPYYLVYSTVPLIFLSYGESKSRRVLQTAREIIGEMSALQPPLPDLDEEWNYLRQQLVKLWKVYCY